MSDVEGRIEHARAWFRDRGWRPFEFQESAWGAYLGGESGLVHAPTGYGKSLAVWMGPVVESLGRREKPPARGGEAAARGGRKASAGARGSLEPIRVLWITPMRALAGDTVKSLAEPIGDLGLRWSIEKRTGDTSASVKLRQRESLPTALVTTPESLSLLLSYAGARERFATLRCVVVDEWHELLSTKRGTQTELCLARLRGWLPGLRTWGLSATLGNLDHALAALLGSARAGGRLISGDLRKEIRVRTLIPESMERFPWAGHLGLRLVEPVVEAIDAARSTLLFTNTRSQAELWFRALLEARPGWMGDVAIHHGSLDRKVREGVEALLRRGALRCVVCTSSLDLGVDFSPVDQVIQVGSPKGVARLTQRAGRSGHRPGATSEVLCVPTNALELVEFEAARGAIASRDVEPRESLERPLDVLVQHLVTAALGEAFDAEAMYEEVRGAWAYRDLSRSEWSWCVDFVTRGGPTLGAYPRFARLTQDGGRLHAAGAAVARLHRLSIGTISSDPSMIVKFIGGRRVGTIEENFIARLSAGDKFVLGGRVLELVRVREMTAYVRAARNRRGIVPRWGGGRSPLSTQLARRVRETLQHAGPGSAENGSEEMRAASSVLELQRRWSRVPDADELLIEWLRTREGLHVYLYPFEGRLVHEGLGALLAHRIAARRPMTLTVTANDWGIELIAAGAAIEAVDREETWRGFLASAGLLEDLLACLNATELTRRQFRDIARVAGLIVPGYPGSARSLRQVQASSELFFDVFREFDPENRLLQQARREVLEQQLESGRLREALEGLGRQRVAIVGLDRLSPLAFGLWAESLRTQSVSSEKWADRVRKMVVRLEHDAETEEAAWRC